MQNVVRNNVVLDLCRADHRHLRPGGLWTHGDGQDHRGVAKRDFFHGRRRAPRRQAPCAYRTPRQAVGDGVVYVTEDRKSEGLFETMSVAEKYLYRTNFEPRVARIL